MKKITYDMLDEFGEVFVSVFHLLYPEGLEIDQLEVKSKDFAWLRMVYERFKES